METKQRTPVIGLHGLECTFCTEAFVRSAHALTKDVVLSKISLACDDTLMADADRQAEALTTWGPRASCGCVQAAKPNPTHADRQGHPRQDDHQGVQLPAHWRCPQSDGAADLDRAAGRDRMPDPGVASWRRPRAAQCVDAMDGSNRRLDCLGPGELAAAPGQRHAGTRRRRRVERDVARAAGLCGAAGAALGRSGGRQLPCDRTHRTESPPRGRLGGHAADTGQDDGHGARCGRGLGRLRRCPPAAGWRRSRPCMS